LLIAPFRVVLDACVLFPGGLRDTLLRAADARVYQVYWTGRILEEMRRSLVAKQQVSEARSRSLVQQMQLAFPEAMVTGHQELEPAMRNHEGDRHVVAAAVRVNAQVIVTSNLKHFEPGDLPEGLEARSADDFLVSLFDLSRSRMLKVVEEQAAALKNPPMTVAQVLEKLARFAPGFARLVREAAERRVSGPG
jgi:predicted nucleic acid-binding protein